MKHIIKIMIPMLLLGAFLTSAVYVTDSYRKSKKVKLDTSTRRPINRTLIPEVNVYYIYDEDILELTCYETKETTVYVLTASGEELSCDTFNSDMTPFYTVDAPDAPGTYWIVIDSPVIYAEGTFIVE